MNIKNKLELLLFVINCALVFFWYYNNDVSGMIVNSFAAIIVRLSMLERS